MKNRQKANIIIILVFLGLIGAVISAVQIYKQHGQMFEARVHDLYGTKNYIGPMTEKVQALTEQEVKEFKSEWGFSYISHDKEKNYNQYEFNVTGRCNREKIEDIYDARDTVCSLMQYFGICYDADTFLYGKKIERTGSKSYDTYFLQQYYKGLRVNNGKIYVGVDDTGNTSFVTIMIEAQEDINIKSVKPKFTKEDILACMDKEYGLYEIEECRLCLDKDEKEWINNDLVKWNLVWEVDVYSEDSLVYCIVFDACTGDVLDMQFACDA